MNNAVMKKHYLNGQIQAVEVAGFSGTILDLVLTIKGVDAEAAKVATCDNWRPTFKDPVWFNTQAWEAYLQE